LKASPAQAFNIREKLEPLSIIGDYGPDSCLLKHDFRNPGPVRVIALSPGKLSMVPSIPEG
jgi:hypothetical protein